MDDNYLVRLPQHVFLKMASYLTADELLILEKSKLFEIVNGRSPLIQLCFDDMKYFKMVLPRNSDVEHYMGTLYRAGPHLKRFKLFWNTGERLTMNIGDAAETGVKLAEKFPNLTVFDGLNRHFACNSGMRVGYYNSLLVPAYVKALNGKSQITELSSRDPKIIKLCPKMKTLVIGFRRDDWSDNEIEEIVAKCPELEKLDVRYLNRTALKLCQQFSKLKNLKELSLELNHYSEELVKEFDPLIIKELKINGNMRLDLKLFINLRKLTLTGCKLTDDLYLDIKNLPNLKSLDLFNIYDECLEHGIWFKRCGSKFISLLKIRGDIIHRMDIVNESNHREFVNELINHCTKLTSVRVGFSYHLTDDGEKFEQEDYMKLANIRVKNFAHFTFFEHACTKQAKQLHNVDVFDKERFIYYMC